MFALPIKLNAGLGILVAKKSKFLTSILLHRLNNRILIYSSLEVIIL